MTAKKLAAALGIKIVQPVGEDNDITCGYTSDLLSDVMANAAEGCAFITIQAHLNTVAVSSLVGAGAIIVCNNYPITDDMIEAAKRENIAILHTEKNQFTVSHLVHEILKG
ncbi:MAG: hypothetical protein LBU70_05520 [Chitinispirillales bacterium]|jgi:hypothetical protein|nr:hypothetical protein [Chitinispirillales bacterium]